jgi:hypothetical protein
MSGIVFLMCAANKLLPHKTKEGDLYSNLLIPFLKNIELLLKGINQSEYLEWFNDKITKGEK